MTDKICVFGSSLDKGTNLEIMAVREGRYIYLTKKCDNKKEYRYDIKDGIFERINHYKTRDDKITPVKVENITGWFTDCSIFCTDKKFARLMIANKYHLNNYLYSSGVRFISTLSSAFSRNYEGWLSLGIKILDIERNIDRCIEDEKKYYYNDRYRPHFSSKLAYHPKDCDKVTLKYIRENYTEIESKVLEDIVAVKDMGLLMEMDKISNDHRYSDLFHYKWSDYNYRQHHRETYEGSLFDLDLKLDWSGGRIRDNILSAIKNYNLDIKSFCEFLLRAYNVEGLTLSDLFGTSHYNDYLKMEKVLKYGKMPKMDKYPRQFLTQFHILKREYNAFKKEYNQEIFKMECDKERWLEKEYKKYRIVVPEKITEIENEADELRHCVRTYIDRVIDGQTLICFLRTNENPKQPLVTIEVKRGFVTQAYGLQDSKPSDEQLDVIRKWAGEKRLRLSWVWD